MAANKQPERFQPKGQSIKLAHSELPFFLTALMLRLIMQDDKSKAQGARLPLKSCFCRRAFRFNVCNKCICRSKRKEEELCEGSRGKTKYMQKSKKAAAKI